MLVTSSYHAPRAGRRLRACSGEVAVTVVPATAPPGPRTLLLAARELLGVARDVLVARGC